MKKLYLLVSVLSCASLSHAQENSMLPEAKLKDAKVSTWNVGAGFTKKIVHGNVEWVNPYGIAYAKAGVFLNDDNDAGGQVGFRYPYHLTGKDYNGYYVGAYAGHVETVGIEGKEEARLGAGIDLSYVMLDTNRISTFGIGIGVGEALKTSQGKTIEKAEPVVQFAYSLSFGL